MSTIIEDSRLTELKTDLLGDCNKADTNMVNITLVLELLDRAYSLGYQRVDEYAKKAIDKAYKSTIK